jgi:hypothetical protein
MDAKQCIFMLLKEYVKSEAKIERNNESPWNTQNDKIENVAGSV